MSNETHSLLMAFWRDLQQPDTFWQAGLLLICLVVAWLVQRLIRERTPEGAGVWKIGHGGLRRMAFPLVSLVLVYVAQQILQHAMHVQLLALAVPLLGSLAIIRFVFYILRLAFREAEWLSAFERSFSLVVACIVGMHIMGILPDVIDFLESVEFSAGKQKLNLWIVLQGAATVLMAVLLALWVGGMLESRLMHSRGLDANLRVVFARLTRAVLLLLAVLISLPLVGIDLTTLSVFGGALGVGLGLGLQKIASSYVSGFIILLDRSIRLGNIIAVNDERGQVTQITTRYTVLKAATGIESIVPNEMLVSSVVRNESLTDTKMRVALPVQVSYGDDVEQAMRILCAAAQAQTRVLADPPPKAFLSAFADSGINLELGFWIADPHEGTLQLRSDINLAIWRAFKEAGIEIPFPQREVRLIHDSVSP